MRNENTQNVVAQQKIDLKAEAMKQLHIIVSDSLKSTRKPIKDFASSAIDYIINRFSDWVDSKLSA